MDNQNNTPKHVPTEAEIARLEAEAAAALQRGEAIPRREPLPEVNVEAAGAPETPAMPDFVPYVDDVPEPVKPAKPVKPVEPAEVAEPVDDEDDDDEEYIPSEMEKRISKMTPRQWKLWQIAGGAAVGAVCVASLFILGQELSAYSLILAAVLAILMPRYLERAWRCKLNTARYALIVTVLIGLIIAFVLAGIHTGFRFTEPK